MDWDLISQQLKICLDLYGSKIEAIACQKILGGMINLNRDFDPSPNTGVSIVPTEFQPYQQV